jgi:hypothetical protein
MADRTPRTSNRLSAIRALRLDAWRAPSTEPTEWLLGSLYPVLGDFAPPRPIVLVPAQRIAPEVAERRRAS